MTDTPIKIGVSACLLGEQVRYDGGHKHDHYITGILSPFFRFVPVCPEVGCGLPIPREAMQLEGNPDLPQLMTIHTRIDLSEQMMTYCRSRISELEGSNLCGFIFKRNSPSCGLEVKIHSHENCEKNGSGLFAAAIQGHFPLLPVEDESRLNAPLIRENFLERIFTYHRWKVFMAGCPTIGSLVEFHSNHKLLLMAHCLRHYREMGSYVANAGEIERTELFRGYESQLMKAMGTIGTVKTQTNVLMHIMGYFKRQLDSDEKKELLDLLNQYHAQKLPLIVPLTLLRHYASKYDQTYLRQQLYLYPHPAELMLRCHA